MVSYVDLNTLLNTLHTCSVHFWADCKRKKTTHENLGLLVI